MFDDGLVHAYGNGINHSGAYDNDYVFFCDLCALHCCRLGALGVCKTDDRPQQADRTEVSTDDSPGPVLDTQGSLVKLTVGADQEVSLPSATPGLEFTIVVAPSNTNAWFLDSPADNSINGLGLSDRLPMSQFVNL